MKFLSHKLSAAMWARALLLWLILAIGTGVLGAILIGMGGFMRSNIRAELEGQQITFKEAERLTDAEAAIPGVVENAGLPLTTGNQALVYSEYILLHASESAEEAGYPDATYATLGGPLFGLRAEIAELAESGDEEALAAAQAELDSITQLRNTMLTASNLRGALLSAYGWDNVATGVTAGGAVLLVMAVIFLVLFFFENSKGHLPPNEAAA